MRGLGIRAALAVWMAATWASAQPAEQPGIHFTVKVRGGQTSFHVGEEIPLELSFSADEGQRYQIDLAAYDPSGRMRLETYSAEPRTGWSDPLDSYYRSIQFPNGSFSNVQNFQPQPYVIVADLNEWIRFDQPGEYRVTVRSRRVRMPGMATPVALVSNELALTITAASPEWQKQTFDQAVAGLNNQATHFTAVKALRFLGTEAAAREMAHRAQEQDCRLGLVGSPAKAAGLDEMQKMMRDPNAPIDRGFLDTLTFLLVPDRPGQHFQEFPQIQVRVQQDLVTAVQAKKGPALTASIRTVLEGPYGVPPEVRQSLLDTLLANFDSLPINEQADLLRNPTTAPERPILAGMLRKMAERYQEFPDPMSPAAMNFNRIAGDALVQWYALDPVSARAAILREIVRPKPRFSINVLGVLPEKELPEVEQALVKNLEGATDRVSAANIAALIGRYASAAPEPTVLARLDRDVAAGTCETQAALLGWLLRVDPAQGKSRLESASKPGTACRLSLAEMGKVHADAQIEAMAVKALDSADLFAVTDATSYLTDYGSAAAEEALWARMAAWNKKWSGHEAELNAAGNEVRVGQSLAMALITGNGWLMDDAKLRRLSDLALGLGLRQQVQQYRQIWQTRPWLVRASGFEQYQIGWYHAVSMVAAKRKLQQFPKGTEFRWIMQGLPGDSADFKELAQFGVERGIRIW